MKLTLTPMDINNKEFKKVMRGYNIEEVDDFLDEIIENYEALYKENASLKDKLSVSSDKIEHYSKIENTIQNTLLLAQNAADQAKTSSEKEAEILIKNANETAQKILDKAHKDVVQINDEYEAVKQEFIKFRAKFRNFINTQLETFNDLEKDVSKSFSISAPVEEEENDYSVPKFENREQEENFDNNEDDSIQDVYEENAVTETEQSEYDNPLDAISFDDVKEASKLDTETVEEEENHEVVDENEFYNEDSTEQETNVNKDDTLVFSDNSIKAIEDTVGQDEIDEIRSFFASKE